MQIRALLVAIAILVGTAGRARAQATPEGDQLGTQVKGGLIGFGLGGLSGVLFGAATAKGKSEAIVIVAALGMLAGPPIGVQIYADNRGGSGQKWGTALGAVAGLTVGATSMYGMLKEKETTSNIISGLVILAACSIAGPVIGYRSTATGMPAMDTTRIIPLTTMAF